MANHVLSLETPDTMNGCLLRVVDTSLYNSMLGVKCILLEVTLPGFVRPVQFTETSILPGFNLNLTACDLEIQTAQCGTVFNDLPDGIYIIKLSVSPNDVVYVEYNHLRITNAMKKYQTVLCDLELGTCDPPEKIKVKLFKLRLIKQYLDAAVAKVEFCHEPDKGLELYKFALSLLNKLNCVNC